MHRPVKRIAYFYCYSKTIRLALQGANIEIRYPTQAKGRLEWGTLRFYWREGLFFDDAFAFLDGYDLSRGNVGEVLSFAVEPLDG